MRSQVPRRYFIYSVSDDMLKIGRELLRLEGPTISGKVVPTFEHLENIWEKAFEAYRKAANLVDQHTGGERSIEDWWFKFFIPTYKKLFKISESKLRKQRIRNRRVPK